MLPTIGVKGQNAHKKESSLPDLAFLLTDLFRFDSGCDFAGTLRCQKSLDFTL